MINDLVQWVAEKIGDQRSYRRKNERFEVAWLVDASRVRAATGLEVSANGIVFQIKEKPKNKEFNIRMTIRSREIRVRVAVKRDEIVNEGGQMLHRLICRFSGIAADDWDALQRYVNDEPEPENKGLTQLNEIQRKEDDAYRLLPLRVQNRLVMMLVGMNRLEQPPKDHAPVLRMHLIGSSRESGREIRRFNVHSRKRIDDNWYAFDTQFSIDPAGMIQLLK
jgi:hypothetical protein